MIPAWMLPPSGPIAAQRSVRRCTLHALSFYRKPRVATERRPGRPKTDLSRRSRTGSPIRTISMACFNVNRASRPTRRTGLDALVRVGPGACVQHCSLSDCPAARTGESPLQAWIEPVRRRVRRTVTLVFDQGALALKKRKPARSHMGSVPARRQVNSRRGSTQPFN